MSGLARKLRTADYFSLGWGTMVGVGWLVVMDDWLLRGGPLGAILGFLIGGLLLLPIGYVYGQLVAAIPDAAGEIAYTSRVFPEGVAFATGWTMLLAYFIVCPWEAVAIGRIAAYLVPATDSLELYRIGGRPVYLPHLVLGCLATALLTALNHRGIRLSANIQNWTAFLTIGLVGIFVLAGLLGGSPRNLQPPFGEKGALVSIFLVLQIVPYFMTGFESVSKVAEEASPTLRPGGYFRAILMAILGGTLFYTVVIGAVAFSAPWKALTGVPFMTAAALERAAASRWVVNVVLMAAFLSLFKVFNGNLVAASRLLFALGRRGLVAGRFGAVHPRNQTPSTAVLWIGAATVLCTLLGQAVLIPISEVGSVASALGWTMACAAYLAMRPRAIPTLIGAVGAALGISMVLMKVLPMVPGHFSPYEWCALGVWSGAGLVLRRRGATKEAP